MSIPLDGTYSVPVSGPSARLAMLRTIMLKAAGIAKNAWAHTRTSLAMASRLPKSVAVTVNSVLATSTGYTTLTRISRAVLSTAWNGLTRLIRGVGRVLRTAVGVVPLAVGFVSPVGADFALRVTEGIAETVTGLFDRLDELVRGAGELAWGLAHTTLVRTTATTAASVASGVFVVHSLTQGLLAVKIVQAAPSLMTAVVWITNPWRTLALVAGVALIAMGVALARLVHGSRQQEQVADDGPQFDPEPPATEQVPFTVVPDPEPLVEPEIDWDAVVSSVRVEITNDGSVVVVGIPNSVPRKYGEIIARIATDAALKHWNRTRVSRPCPSRDDRRLFTKAAKEAVRDYARNQAA